MGIGYGRITSNRRVIQIKDLDGTVKGTISITKPNKKKTKKFRYNFKALSVQIRRAKTPVSAKQAAVKARSKAAMLRQKLHTGEYDDQELLAAIIHAEQMERTARKKQKNLNEEQLQAGKMSPDSMERALQRMILERLKKKHRQKEDEEILDADLKYLKSAFEKMNRDKAGASSGAAASLELGGQEMLIADGAEMPVPTEGASVDTTV